MKCLSSLSYSLLRLPLIIAHLLVSILLTWGRRFREIPPGLLQHVLTVLVFCSWVLLLPRLPPSSRSLKLLPWASILFQGLLDVCLDLLPATPLPPMQKRDACTAHAFTAHGGHTPKDGSQEHLAFGSHSAWHPPTASST